MRHAYLILAHKFDYLLCSLIKTIDYPGNDIYILFDKKAKVKESDIKMAPKHSQLRFVPGITVEWGGYSIVKAQMMLLTYASRYNYDYYHFMSGQDLCIKSQKYIQNFFTKNKDKIFISFNTNKIWNNSIRERYERYHITVGKGNDIKHKVKSKMDYFLVGLQKLFHIKRRIKIKIAGGSNWCSVPEYFAKYILKNARLIKKTFSYTSCSDELYIHTICYNSKFMNLVYAPQKNKELIDSSCRLIDWERSDNFSPHTFTEQDYDLIINSANLFARKFAYSEDNKLVDKILDYLNLLG